MDGDDTDDGDAVRFLPEEHFDLFQRIVTEQVDAALNCGVSHSLQEAIIHLSTPDTTLLDPYHDWFDFRIEALYPADESFDETPEDEVYRLVLSADETVEHTPADELLVRYRQQQIDKHLADDAPLECPDCGTDAVGRRWEMHEADGAFAAGGATLLCDECEWAAEVDTKYIAAETDGDPMEVAARVEAAVTTGHVPDDLAEAMYLGVESNSDRLI